MKNSTAVASVINMSNVVRMVKKVGALQLPMFKFSFHQRKIVKADSLRMDILLQFAFLALCLFVIVKNSPAANDAFGSILTTAKGQITNLFNSMGSF